jgi:hypothetical protein
MIVRPAGTNADHGLWLSKAGINPPTRPLLGEGNPFVQAALSRALVYSLDSLVTGLSGASGCSGLRKGCLTSQWRAC